MNLVHKLLTRRTAADLRVEIERNAADIASAEAAVSTARDALDEAVATGDAGEDAAVRALTDARALAERHAARRDSLLRALDAAESRETAARLEALLADAHAAAEAQMAARVEYDRKAAATVKALRAWETADATLDRINREITNLGGEPVGGPYATHVRDGLTLPSGTLTASPHHLANPRADGRLRALNELVRETKAEGERQLDIMRNAAMDMLKIEWASQRK